MRTNNWKAILKAALGVVCILPFAAVVALGQQTVNLTAGATTVTLPDGSVVPMWGYTCGTVALTGPGCRPLNLAAPAATATTPAGWSPVVITVPYVATGTSLTINLTNSLTFTGGGIPTSLVIVGQLGAGLGDLTQRTTTLAPDHTALGTPPRQGPRVQSFSTEVAAGATGVPLTWSNLKPGTYLIESGTHPSIQGPMGLYGILVVTTAPAGATAGTAYPAVGTTPAVTYNAEVPLLLSEIDPVQNNAVYTAVNTAGFSETKVWSGQPGQCGNPTSPIGTVNTCYPPAVNYTPLYYLFNGVAFNKTSASTSLFAATAGTTTNAAGTIVPVTTGITGNILVRLVNAGLRMHVPSIVGTQTGVAVAPATTPPSGFSLIAEDGNPLPGVPRVQSEVFLPAGKTYDVMVNVPTGGSALPVFDRQLSLSGNATERDAGMLAYIGVNSSTLPSSPSIVLPASVVANQDIYNSLTPCSATPCPAFTVSDPGKRLIATDVNVYGVDVFTPAGCFVGVPCTLAHGTLTLNANGTFAYVPSAAGINPDSFVYQANGTGPTANVTLGAAQIENASGIIVGNKTYTSNTAAGLSIKPAGVLSTPWDSCIPTVANPCHDRDAAGYPLTVAMSTGNAPVSSAGLTLAMDPNGDGGFTAYVSAAGTYTFTYKAQNSQGTVSSSTARVTLIFPAPTGLVVKVLDGKDKTTVISDYRWIIEEDRTFYVNPNCTTNSSIAITGCTPLANTNVPMTFDKDIHH